MASRGVGLEPRRAAYREARREDSQIDRVMHTCAEEGGEEDGAEAGLAKVAEGELAQPVEHGGVGRPAPAEGVGIAGGVEGEHADEEDDLGMVGRGGGGGGEGEKWVEDGERRGEGREEKGVRRRA